MKKSAKAFIAEIDQNVDAYYADWIDSKTFGARQRTIWDEIEAAGPRIKNAVIRHLREQLPPVSGGSRARGLVGLRGNDDRLPLDSCRLHENSFLPGGSGVEKRGYSPNTAKSPG